MSENNLAIEFRVPLDFECKILNRVYDEREYYGVAYDPDSFIDFMKWIGTDTSVMPRVALKDLCEWQDMLVLISRHKILFNELCGSDNIFHKVEIKTSELAIALRMNRLFEKYKSLYFEYESRLK